jgi:hypothetical protein
MTDPNYKALCAELVDKIEGMCPFGPDEEHLTNRARAALTQPEPVAPTDEELIEPIVWMIDERVYDTDKGEIAESLHELIARWGNYPVKPDSSLSASLMAEGHEATVHD